jgi:hypothetical protein
MSYVDHLCKKMLNACNRTDNKSIRVTKQDVMFILSVLRYAQAREREQEANIDMLHNAANYYRREAERKDEQA